MNFGAFVDDIRKNGWNIFGAELYVDGALVHRFGDTDTRFPIYSATKTITSIAVGLAVDDGLLDIERPVTDYLPEKITTQMSLQQLEAYRPITLRRLMTMSVAGYPFRPEGESWLRSSLSYPLSDTGKKAFDYSNIPAYLAGVAAACALGEDLYLYLDRRLFGLLGISAPPCGRCPDGYFYGASKMMLSVNELSRIGLMLCDSGVYNGQRILSGQYVQDMTALQQMNREGGYGYFLWKYRNGFVISGKWKQKCYVLPEERIVITLLSHIEEDDPRLVESMEKNILGL